MHQQKPEYIYDLVKKYGEDPFSYLMLEGDKTYFLSKVCEGFIAYVVVGKIAVCLGNPVCPGEKRQDILAEFEDFCRGKKLSICFSSVYGAFSKVLERTGYCISKYGEEAFLDLDVYKLTGGSTMKLRQKVRRAEKQGIRVMEYQPRLRRDTKLENEINQVSEEWYAEKTGRLTFTLGELNLGKPLDRRYFISVDGHDRIQAVLVFAPFLQGQGYFLDVMRRKRDAVPGIMEKSIIDAAMTMKEEGVRWISLGVAPLAGLDKQEKLNPLERYFQFTYDHMNQNYNFKTLYHYKKKFAPSYWVDRHIAHQRELSYFNVGMAIIKARKVNKVWSQLIRGLWRVGKVSVESVIKQVYPGNRDNQGDIIRSLAWVTLVNQSLNL